MKKYTSIISIFSILFTLALLASCSSSNEVVSNNFITKRKYNKGFHIDFKKRYEGIQGQELATKDVKKTKEQDESIEITESTELEENSNMALNSNNDLSESEKSTDLVLIESNCSSLETVNNKFSDNQSLVKSGNTIESSYSDKVQNNTKLKNKKNIYKTPSKGADEKTILLVILCFILSPLAVFLHQGSWNTKCWINLILFLLFIFPGLLHGLYVILVD
jgi:uncharacterized membrane protein YqaE (UPF0057 family)